MSDNPGYFITAPRFMADSPEYAWLNHVQAVGKMVSLQRGVRIKYDLSSDKVTAAALKLSSLGR